MVISEYDPVRCNPVLRNNQKSVLVSCPGLPDAPVKRIRRQSERLGYENRQAKQDVFMVIGGLKTLIRVKLLCLDVYIRKFMVVLKKGSLVGFE